MSIKDFRPTVLISSGGTIEAIDNVRVMSNVSTGSTGATIAEMFLANGWEVIYIHGIGAKLPDIPCNLDFLFKPIEISTAEDACDKILWEAPKADAIIHALAVSDFTFELSDDVKLDSSDSNGFIEYLRKTIRSNVKILPLIRGANKDAYIMGFKYTVGKTKDEQVKISKAQILTANLDSTFVNDDVDMRDSGDRCGTLVTSRTKTNTYSRIDSAKAIYMEVCEAVRKRAESTIGFKLMDVKNPFK
jgi:phosphopantothenoylcysteine decarboxylase/phosphopantothenate--cysteine ligase